MVTTLWNRIRAAFRALFTKQGTGVANPVESIAKTMEESTHVRGGRWGLPRASTEEQHEIVVEGHEAYLDSFEDGDRPG